MKKQYVHGWLVGWAVLGTLVPPLAWAEAVAQEPSWDAVGQQICSDRHPVTAPDSYYRENGDGTITDRLTGLIWKQCHEGLSGNDCRTGQPLHFTWETALEHAEAAVFAGSDQWRAPNIKELASLVELQCTEPAINLRFFPNSDPYYFWSSTTYPRARDGDITAYGVGFSDGQAYHYDKRLDGYLRLVRDGR